MCIYIYIYIHTYIIYVLYICIRICAYMCIYIYIYDNTSSGSNAECRGVSQRYSYLAAYVII